MNFFLNFFRLLFAGLFILALVSCQTTKKIGDTVEESADSFDYIQPQSQAEQERLQQELLKAKQERERLQAEADKAREAQSLAEEKMRLEAEELAKSQSAAAQEQERLKAKAGAEAAQAGAEAAQAGAEAAQAGAEAAQAEQGVVNDSVPMGMPTSSVYFDFDNSFIAPKFDDVIQSHAGYLRSNPDLKVEIQGNCDERGSREYNIGLGNRRALAVKAALELLGVQGRRITITSFGSEKPVELGHDESNWQQNRSAVFLS
ncbi:MAG: OmpA family protein [Proteobacteria bacterium]|nr:OmpA family protein [Pseudomonadota bacterium]